MRLQKEQIGCKKGSRVKTNDYITYEERDVFSLYKLACVCLIDCPHKRSKRKSIW